MKQLLVSAVAGFLLLYGCKKETGTSNNIATEQKQTNYLSTVQAKLQDSLTKPDYETIDFSKAFTTIDTGKHCYYLRLGIKGKLISADFLLVKTDAAGHVIKGRFVNISKDSSQQSSFTGSITLREMKGSKVSTTSFAKGRASTGVQSNLAQEPEMDGGDLPPVVVVAYIDNGGISYADWYNLEDMAGDDGSGYSGYYSPSSGGGGGGTGTAPTAQVDFDSPESVDAVSIKNYIDCFGAVQDASATYTITIAADIPVDNDPSAFFNWSEGSPGHTFIELYKNSSTGLVEQNIGFYPNTSWKTVAGGDISSKIGDDAGHEYNAKYTISVTASQFQAALNAAQAYSTNDYNIATYNCADYALAVFNAAGGGLNVPKFQIPGYPSANGSNTPEGVYDAVQSLVGEGKTNAMANAHKQYGSNSHGPCD